MKKHCNRKGFTLAEVLVVVAIIVVLMGVGAVALFSHMRNMQKLEMDGQAKELFIAAQNHLSLAGSQGYLGVAEFNEGTTTPTGNFGTPDPDGADSTIPGVYYIIVNGGAGSSTFSSGNGSPILNQMLPFASMDESARAGGSYIIRYQSDPAQILDVFYVSKSGRFGLEGGFEEDDYINYLRAYIDDPSKLDLKEYGDGNAVVGYYGGTLPATLQKGQDLLVPTVTIHNEEKLYVEVTNPNSATTINDGKNALVLVISNGVAQVSIHLVDNDGEDCYSGNTTRVTSSGDTYTVMLDDVTELAKHFGSVAAGTGKEDDFVTAGFLPGDNITIQAIAYTNQALVSVAQSAPQTTNSLFASRSSDTVEIAYLRHLLNLDKAVSNLNAAPTTANQTRDLTWAGFKTAVEMGTTKVITVLKSGATAGLAGEYRPVNLDYKLDYKGQGHSITGIEAISGTTNVGLFGSFGIASAVSSVSELNLVNFNLKTTAGAAGALAASVTNTNITSVLVHNSDIGSGDDSAYAIQSESGNAGGLVGSMSDGKINQSAAAVYVKAGGNAGGLVGVASGTPAISSSYSGGHTYKAEYRNNDDTETGKLDGRLNVIGGAAAGGLIGDASGATNLDLQYCYSTCSASATVAGGLIGKGGSGSVKFSYATGLVFGGSTMDPFIGNAADTDVCKLSYPKTKEDVLNTETGETSQVDIASNYYLEGVSETVSGIAAASLLGVTAGDTNYGRFMLTTDYKAAVTYDAELGQRYAFPTIEQLHRLNGETGWTAPDGFAGTFLTAHYGDWQLPSLEKLPYTLVNSHTLYTEVTLNPTTSYVTLALCGETSGKARVYRLKLDTLANGQNVVIDAQEVGLVSDTSSNDGIVWDTSAPTFSLPCASTTKNAEGKNVLRITLDGITQANQHFANLFPELTPGEDVTLLLGGGKCSWPALKTLKTTTDEDGNIYAKTDNSLFGSITEVASGDPNYSATQKHYTAEIKLIRHLQNLDTSTSNVNASAQYVAYAKLTKNIDWKLEEAESESEEDVRNYAMLTSDEVKSYENVYKYAAAGSTTVVSNTHFNGIYNTYLRGFDGDNYTIKNMAMGATYGVNTTDAGNAGFFRLVNADLEIKNLRLLDPQINNSATGATGATAAFVASHTSGTLKLDTVLAEGNYQFKKAASDEDEPDPNIKLVGNAEVGGLVGLSSGGSLTINNSASSMLITGVGTVGGLVGEKSGGSVTITNSYVSGHTGYYTNLGEAGEKYHGGLYYTGSSVGDDHGRWNIASTAGVAGGILGDLGSAAKATISNTFNAASVYAPATGAAGGIIGNVDGTIEGSSPLNLCYVVAPVYNVQEIVEGGSAPDYTYTPQSGNAGSIIGTSSKAITGSSATGSGFFYLPDTYAEPMPMLLNNNGYNIKTLGDGTGSLSNAKAASYYEVDGGDNSILGVDAEFAHIEQHTLSCDPDLSSFEFPFAIWTTFAFENREGSAQRYYYGDWQPMPSVSSIHLVVHYVTEIPSSAADGTGRIVKSVPDFGTVTNGIQLPYRKTKFAVQNYPEEVFGYRYGASWNVYLGNWAPDADGTAWPAEGLSSTYRVDTVTRETIENNGNYYTLEPKVFKLINQESNYRTASGGVYTGVGDPYIHVTFVLTYEKIQDSLFKLNFFDQEFTVDSEGKPKPAGTWPTDPTNMQVVEHKFTEDATTVTLAQLLNKTNVVLPTYYKEGYRLAGWSYGDEDKLVVANTYTSSGFQLQVTSDASSFTFTKAQAEENPNIDLKAVYYPIVERTLTINFVDTSDPPEAVPNLDPYVIKFESDRGFAQDVVLPGDQTDPTHKKLWPATDAEDVLTPNDSTVSPNWDNLLLTFNISPAIGNTTALTYTVKYNVETPQPAGYAILFELEDTTREEVNSPLKYAERVKLPDGTEKITTYIFPTKSTDVTLLGVTEPGEWPDVNPEDASLMAYLSDNLHVDTTNEFIVSGMTIVPVDKIASTPAYARYNDTSLYPGSVAQGTGTDAKYWTTKYLVVFKVSRRTYLLDFDLNGGEGSWALEKMRAGASILTKIDALKADGTHPLSRAGYQFDKWTYTEAGSGTVSDVTSATVMPTHDLTVTANWKGDPSEFMVLFWLQDPNDGPNGEAPGYTLIHYEAYDKSNADLKNLMANAGTTVLVTPGSGNTDDEIGGISLNWTNTDAAEQGLQTSRSYSKETLLGKAPELKYAHLNTAKTTNVTMTGDNATTVNIYYDRNFYTLWFFLGRATNASIGADEMWDETETHRLSEYKLRSGGSMWAYQDPAGALYGNEGTGDNKKYFPVELKKRDVKYYKPLYTYTAVNENDSQPTDLTANPRYGLSSDGYYGELTRENKYTYTVATTRTTNETYYAKVGEDYLELTLDGPVKKTRLYYTYGMYSTKEYYESGDRYKYHSGLKKKDNWTTPQAYYYYNYSLYPLTRKKVTNKNEYYWQVNINGYNYNLDYDEDFYYVDAEGMYYYAHNRLRELKEENSWEYYWKRDNTIYSTAVSDRESLQPGHYTYNGTIYTRSGSVEWKLNGETYTGNRYSRAGYTADTDYSENDSHIKNQPEGYFRDDNGGLVELNSEYERIDKEEYYEDTEASTEENSIEYDAARGILRLISAEPHEVPGGGFAPTSNTEYYISGNDNIPQSFMNASSSGGFSSKVKVTVTNPGDPDNNPFKSAYTRICYEDIGNVHYVAFYRNITARYGAEIIDEWIDLDKMESWNMGAFGTRTYASIAVNSNSQYYKNYQKYEQNHSDPAYKNYTMGTLKGRYATMSEDIIVVNNKAVSDNGQTGGGVNDDGVKQNIAHIFECRYRTSQYDYTYKIYLGTGGRNPANPTFKTEPDYSIRVYSKGKYGNQTKIPFDGYDSDLVTQSPNGDGTGVPGVFDDITYKYTPYSYYIHFFVKNSEGKFEEVNTLNSDERTTKDRYYYNSNLTNADHPTANEDYRPKANDIPDGYKFYGWYTNPLGEGKAFDLTKDRMPNGDLFLYAIVNPKPNQLHFSLPAYEGKQPVWKGTTSSATRTVGTADSALEAGQTDDKIPYNWTFERYAESDLNTGNYSWSYFTPDDIKDSEGNTLYTFGGWAMGSGTSEREFYETQRITGTWTLHPIWKPVEMTEATVTVQYIDTDGNTIYPSENVLVTLNQPKLFKATAKTGYTVTPSFEYANIDSAWLDSHKQQDGSYVLTFLYSESSSAWTYTTEYYLLLKEDGGSGEKGFLLKTESEVPASGEYAFKAFYSLPDYPNYEVARLEVYEGESTTPKATTTQPGIQMQKGTDVVLKVYIVPVALDFDSRSYTDTYDGTAKGIEVTGLPTPPTLSGDVKFDAPVYDYYLGSQKLSGKPTNAGIYRVQIKITLTDDSGTYIFWRSPAYQSSSKPGVLFTIRRCDVLLISRDVDYVFLNTEDNRTALAGNSKVRLDSVARYQTGDGNLLTYGTDVPEAIKALLDGDTPGAMKNLTISLSADAFRSIPTKEEGDRTPNAFTCQVKNLDQNNFNIYKQYGYIYFWESLDDYKEVTGNQTVTGHD